MNQVLQTYRQLSQTPHDGVRWACLLEATAPKAGNVFPGQSFADLRYRDFVDAAEIASQVFGANPDRFSTSVLEGTRQVADQIGTNVNLGILLLLGPLVQVDQTSGLSNDDAELIGRVTETLHSLDAVDANQLYEAINMAHPGGMGKVDEMDLADSAPPSFLDAMAAAADRDQIAANYANGFEDLISCVLPMLDQAVQQSQDILTGISIAHLRLLADREDSLIERKFGRSVAIEVRRKADFDHDDLHARMRFDAYLRTSYAKPLNPGTTADMIAAGLYCLLRRGNSNPWRVNHESTDISR
ncbi:triphosphoribosyl-dephospho-CoA synthase [Roseiconus lacunae]|uniref:Triphosphoribosyl-dephospho-CoA synthase n=1 Tax=Roseiconus lacunae TaxID=2605694 RepID=A0ABT7PEA9_9BACT|nr:triphosphoribosyl-dephospho-CoA synthase [Roseiconus lacunae]MDM4014830.1 triphosphoribosyl-dephospho-CoA synthase [Roseiconus lacunae]